jgi:hypothetical protein
MTIIAKIGAALLAAMLAGAASVGPALADEAPVAADATARLNAVTEKFNAYVDFLNRTLRASESIDRYRSWVNWTTGPTGRERIIYGL